MRIDTSFKSRALFKLWQALAFSHGSYILSRSIHYVWVNEDFNLELTPAFIMWSVGYIGTCSGVSILFDKWPGITVKCFNEFHTLIQRNDLNQQPSLSPDEVTSGMDITTEERQDQPVMEQDGTKITNYTHLLC